jgi:hypothetical protein
LAKVFIIKLFCFCFVFSHQSFAETINLVAEAFPPQTHSNGTGQQFDVAKAIFEPLGYKVNIEVYPYRRVIYLLEHKQVDMAVGVARVDNTELLFSEQPHDSDNLVAIYPKENNVIWRGINSLRGKRLLFISGLTEGLSMDFNLSENTVSEVNTRVQALKKLLSGRDDFLIDCECGFFLDEVESYRSLFTVNNIGFIKIYAGFSNTEKGLKLKNIWKTEFPKFIKTDKAREIYKKWGLMREYEIILKLLKNTYQSMF